MRYFIFSSLLYIVSFGWLIGSAKRWWSLPRIYLWILSPAILIAKDFFVVWQKASLHSLSLHTYDWAKIQDDQQSWKLPSWYSITLIVRKYVFPTFLTIYLLYLLIEKTAVWNLHVSTPFLSLNKSFLLTMTIVSWIVMFFGEKWDKRYTIHRSSITLSRFCFALIAIISVVWWYLILQEVMKLWVVWIIIANIVVLLLFFIWLLLLEEDY